MTKRGTMLVFALILALGACGREPAPAPGGETQEPGDGTVEITNRIPIPPRVVGNLGLTFVRVEDRRVEQTLRVPGHFESPPEARREYQAMLPGRIELLVDQYDAVNPGDPLFHLDSADWRDLQGRLATLRARVVELDAGRGVILAERQVAEESLQLYTERFEALEELRLAGAGHLKRLEETRDHWRRRVTELEELAGRGGGKADELAEARGRLLTADSEISNEAQGLAEIAERKTTLEAERREREIALRRHSARLREVDVEIANAREHFDRALRAAGATLGVDHAELAKDDAWRSLDTITIRARAPGTVQSLDVSSGAWVDARSRVLATLDLSMPRFRARAPQADLGLLEDGQPARVVPPRGGSLELSNPVTGKLRIPTEAHAGERVFDVLVIPDSPQPWARPGITAEAEIVFDATAHAELAIPVRCVVQDGLDKVIFARDPQDPDKVIRYTPEFGISDGRWIVIYDSVMAGQQVVLDGAYELKLTGSGKPAEGGHFHADGTWHAGDDH